MGGTLVLPGQQALPQAGKLVLPGDPEHSGAPASPAQTIASGATPEQVQAATQAESKKQLTAKPMHEMAPLESSAMAEELDKPWTPVPGGPAARIRALNAGSPPISNPDDRPFPTLLHPAQPLVPKGSEGMAEASNLIPQVAGAVAPAETFGPAAEFLGKASGAAMNAAKRGLGISGERAAQNFNAVSAAVGKHPVEITDNLSHALTEIQRAVDNGGTMPMSVRKLIVRLTNPDKGPLTYDDARQFASNISELSADEKMRLKPSMKRLAGNLRVALNDAVSQTAQRGGKLEQFQQAMKEYGKSKRASEIATGIGDAVKKRAAQTAIGGGTGYAAYKLIDDFLGRK